MADPHPAGATVRRLRLDLRMSVDELARRAGLSVKQVRLIEQGKVRPRDTTLFKLAGVLKVRPSVIDARMAA